MISVRRLITQLLVSSVLLVYLPTARSFYATFDSNARLAEEYNSNLFLNPGPHREAWGQGLDGGMTMTGIERDWKTAVSANFQNRWYVTDRNLDYFNQFFSWKNSYFTQRSKFALDLQYNNDNVLTSQADVFSTLGYAFQRRPRTDRIIGPQWSFTLTPRTLLNVSYNYRDSSYENSLSEEEQGANVFPNSLSHLGSVDVSYDWSKRLQVFASSYYSYYALTYPADINRGTVPVPVFQGVVPFPGIIYTPQITSDIQTASLSIGGKYQASETIEANASVGVQHNQTHRPAYDSLTRIELSDGTTVQGPNLPNPGLSSNAFTQIFALGLTKRLKDGLVGFSYNRTIQPNLLGDLITADGVNLFAQHQFSSRLASNINLSYYDQTFPAGNTRTSTIPIAQSINRYAMDSTLNWFFLEDWSLNASYRLYYQEYHYITDSSAISHGVYVYLLHNFDQLRL